MSIYHSVTELIGRTPLVELTGYEKKHHVPAEIVAKVELFNPAGSIKDRIAAAMLEDAEEKGLINKDTVIIEPTSGNTGVALAAFAAARGYRLIITMPETMSVERRRLMSAYGAELVLTPGPKMVDAIAKADEMAKEIPNSFIPGQFTNPATPKTQYNTTGPGIWKDTDGKVDIFIAGIGTGGTLSGAGKYLREQNPDIKIIGIEPTDSPVLTQGHPGVHKIQGIGAGFIPDTLDTKIYDEIIAVKNEDAFVTGREIARTDGILVGISSGAALWAATQVAARPENKGKRIVVIFPDTGERYLSTALFAEE